MSRIHDISEKIWNPSWLIKYTGFFNFINLHATTI